MSFHNRMFFRTPIDVPPDADPTGEYVRYGTDLKPVLRELRPEEEITVLVPMVRQGKEVVMFVQGQPVRTRTERIAREMEESEKYREYILVDRGNGEVKKEFAFRPAADEVQRAAMEQAASPERVLAELASLREIAARQQQLLDAIGLKPGDDPAAAQAGLEGRKPDTSTFKGRQQLQQAEQHLQRGVQGEQKTGA